MNRNALTAVTSAWALVAYLGFLLLAAPCTCLAKPAPASTDSVCCCGPNAKTHCAPKSEGGDHGDHGDCDGALGAGCSHAVPKATACDTVPVAEELPLPAPAQVLTLELSSPELSLVARSRARGPSPPAPRLDQVRSTVLLI